VPPIQCLGGRTEHILSGKIAAQCLIAAERRGGRVVECTGLENRQGFTTFVSSNLTLSATGKMRPRCGGSRARSLKVIFAFITTLRWFMSNGSKTETSAFMVGGRLGVKRLSMPTITGAPCDSHPSRRACRGWRTDASGLICGGGRGPLRAACNFHNPALFALYFTCNTRTLSLC